jgi:hypothetical protein
MSDYVIKFDIFVDGKPFFTYALLTQLIFFKKYAQGINRISIAFENSKKKLVCS